MSMDNYERIKVLGEGSFGKVYLMRDLLERKLCCMKVIKVKNLPRKEREACKTEVELLKRLHHPNIVGYKDSFLTPRSDCLCIAMEYCDGGDLCGLIKGAKRRLFAESKILNLFVQMSLGLHYMHSHRVLHRDLKTQNIFMLGNGRLVLGDLGISKVLDGTMDFASTCIGTPYYMSPEIFKNKPYNHKSDIWALGCVLYEMTTLNHAFDATSLNGLASKIVKGRYPPVNPKYSSSLRDLISKMLSISPADRPDLDAILTLNFIKKHIQNFIADIMTREHGKLGEGTMVFKAAAVNIAGGADGSSSSSSGAASSTEHASLSRMSNNRDMLTLQQQMEELGLQSVVAKALSPPDAERPTTAVTAVKVAKEQASALRREEDRKQAVESALARLRQEREDRLRKRQASLEAVRSSASRAPAAAAVGQGMSPLLPSFAGNSAVAGLPPPVQSNRVPGSLQSQAALGAKPSRAAGAQPVPTTAAVVREAREVRKSVLPGQAAAAVPSSSKESGLRQKLGRGDDSSSSNAAAAGGVAMPPPVPRVSKRSDVADGRVTPRDSNSDKYGQAREAERLAEEALQKRRDDAARRDAARSKEKSRQQEEQDKLRQDALELDRRMAENMRLREARKEKEKEREKASRATAASAADAAAASRPAPPVSRSSHNSGSGSSSAYRDPFDKERERERERHHRRSESDSINGSAHASTNNGDDASTGSNHSNSSLTARERMLARKKQKAAEEEALQLEALAAAAADSAKHREQRQSRQRGQYVSSMDNNVIDSNSSSSSGSSKKGAISKGSMEPYEVAAKLPAGARRYSNSSDNSTSTAAAGAAASTAEMNRAAGGTSPRSVCSAAETDDGTHGNSSDSDDNDGYSGTGVWSKRDSPTNLEGPDEADEDIHQREEELIAELEMSTMRCKELRTTLQETKSILGVAAGAGSGSNKAAAAAAAANGGAVAAAAKHAAAVTAADRSNRALSADKQGKHAVERVAEDCNEDDEIDEDIDDIDSFEGDEEEGTTAVTVAEDNENRRSNGNSGSSSRAAEARTPRYSNHNSNSSSSSAAREAKHGSEYNYHSSSSSSNSSVAVPPIAVPKHVSHRSSSSSGGAKGTPRDAPSPSVTPRTVTPRAVSPHSPPAPGSSMLSFTPSTPPKDGVRGVSPTGRLGDRIRVLRSRCIEGLGQSVFERAYAYLRQLEEAELDGDDSYGANDLSVSFSDGKGMAGLTEILGQSKIHYYNLIDQLIFIENTHESSSPC